MVARHRIFVQIASYCDPECAPTLVDMFAKARHPDRIFVGICWQYRPGEDPEACAVPPGREKQARQLSYPAGESHGSNWARLVAFGLAQDEEYIMVIDSHMRFEPNWDELAIAMLHACPTPRAVLSTFASNYEGKPLHLDDPNHVYRITATKLAEANSPQIVHLGGVRTDSRTLRGPVRSPMVVFHFIFGRAAVFEEVPIDPHLYFNGIEITYSARLWTHGIDIYQPHRRLIYHQWKKAAGSYKSLAAARVERSRQRVLHLLKMAETKDPQALLEIDRYKLGEVRKLEEFWPFFGIDPQKQVLSEKAYYGQWG